MRGSNSSDAAWELTVVTKDKPFLFSNISGVLSSFGMDILRGYAFTKPDGLVVDMFHFIDEERFLELNPEDGEALIIRRLEEVVAGRTDVPTGSRDAKRARSGSTCRALRRWSTATTTLAALHDCRDRGREPSRPVVPYQSRHVGVGVRRRPVLIATEGRRAIDVFHLTAAAETDAGAQAEVTVNLHRVLEGRS